MALGGLFVLRFALTNDELRMRCPRRHLRTVVGPGSELAWESVRCLGSFFRRPSVTRTSFAVVAWRLFYGHRPCAADGYRADGQMTATTLWCCLLVACLTAYGVADFWVTCRCMKRSSSGLAGGTEGPGSRRHAAARLYHRCRRSFDASGSGRSGLRRVRSSSCCDGASGGRSHRRFAARCATSSRADRARGGAASPAAKRDRGGTE